MKNPINSKNQKSHWDCCRSFYTVFTHLFIIFSMSDYYSDGQRALTLTSSESDNDLQVDGEPADECSFLGGDEECTPSHITEQGRKCSLLCIPTAEVAFSSRSKCSSKIENLATSAVSDCQHTVISTRIQYPGLDAVNPRPARVL